MIKILAISAIAIALTLQVCDKGCLKCSPKNECLFCDTTSNYFLSSGNCALSSLTNCLLLNLSGECGQCQANFSLDAATKKCVAVPAANQVPNCALYGFGNTCLRCAKGFFIGAGKCAAVTKPVENCETYADDGKCAACAAGAIFNLARDGCTASPNAPGCAGYSFLDCRTCAGGFVQNRNLYLANYLASAGLIFADLQRSFGPGLAGDWMALSRCQRLLDPNCLEASLFDVCAICKPKFFLTANKQCRAYPYEIIEACLTYSSLTSCSGCQSGHYLESAKRCAPISGDRLIADCAAYNGRASSVQCVLCPPARFLSANSCASLRVNSVSIENCKSLAVAADACAACNDGFVLTGDGRKCLAAISNCAEYAASSALSTFPTCSACVPSYYLSVAGSATTCVPGAIEGCLSYNAPTVCIACNPGEFYLSNAKCSRHVKSESCLSYSGSNFNECASCSLGFFPFKLSVNCPAIAVIANCVEYSSATTCKTCAAGNYFFGNKCAPISAISPNCVAAVTDSPTCGGCGFRYALKALSDKTCALNHNYILNFCDTVGAEVAFKAASGKDADSCKVCKENAFPLDLGFLTVCIGEALLAARGVSAEVAGCRKYSSDAAPLCQQCPLFLKIDAAGTRSCVASCDPATSTHLLDDLAGTVNACTLMNGGFTANAILDCAVAVKARIAGNFALTCLKTINTRKPLFAISSATLPEDNATIWRDLIDSTITRPEAAFLYFGVPMTPSTGETAKHPTVDSNCEVFWKGPNNLLYCARCVFGYTVRFKNLTVPPTWAATDDYNTTCEGIADCDDSKKYTGFKATLNRFLSCHVCKTAGKFVTVVLGVANADDDKAYKIKEFANDKLTVACRSTAAPATYDAPLAFADCLVFGWNLKNDNPAAPLDPAVAKGCLACKPGYKMSYGPVSDVFGTGCTLVASCDLDASKNLMANRCTECVQVDGAGSSTPRALADYQGLECRLVKSKNCLFAGTTPDGDSKYDCRVCRKGYWLNHDKVCEAVVLPECADGAGSTNLYVLPASPGTIGSWAAGAIEEYYALKFLAKANSITGCDVCYAGFIGFRLVADEKQCTASAYVAENKFLAAPLKYITDCLRYNNDLNAAGSPAATCAACKLGKILTEDAAKCVDKILKCLTAQSGANSAKCRFCESGSIAVSGACQETAIAKCAEYDQAVNLSAQFCAACQNGYVLATGKQRCYVGKVTGCRAYELDQPHSCKTCLDGYARVATANSKTYCFPISKESNCQSLEGGAGGLQDGLFKCNLCKVGPAAAYFAKAYPNSDASLAQSVCLGLNLREKCVAYDSALAAVSANSFLCTACAAGFFLDEELNICALRANQSGQCVEYEVARDRCKRCSDSTFLNENGTDCVAFPNGILRCAAYSNETVCTGCNPSAYLSGNACPLSTVIQKCAAYSANYTCTACEANHFLTNSTFCEPAKAANCLTFASLSACEKCDPLDANKGLRTDASGITSCVDKNVPNCEVSSGEFPFKCTQCKRGFYVGSDGNCAAAATINKCRVYDSAATCAVCDAQSLLAADRRSCDDKLFVAFNDANCVESQILAAPVCSRCAPGSIFVDSACAACSNNTFSAGCFSCDPANQSNCFACRPGFSQNQNGQCVALSGQTSTNGTTVKGSLIFGALQVLGIILVGLF